MSDVRNPIKWESDQGKGCSIYRYESDEGYWCISGIGEGSSVGLSYYTWQSPKQKEDCNIVIGEIGRFKSLAAAMLVVDLYESGLPVPQNDETDLGFAPYLEGILRRPATRSSDWLLRVSDGMSALIISAKNNHSVGMMQLHKPSINGNHIIRYARPSHVSDPQTLDRQAMLELLKIHDVRRRLAPMSMEELETWRCGRIATLTENHAGSDFQEEIENGGNGFSLS